MSVQLIQKIALQIDDAATIQQLSDNMKAKSIEEAGKNIRNAIEIKLRSVTQPKVALQVKAGPPATKPSF